MDSPTQVQTIADPAERAVSTRQQIPKILTEAGKQAAVVAAGQALAAANAKSSGLKKGLARILDRLGQIQKAVRETRDRFEQAVIAASDTAVAVTDFHRLEAEQRLLTEANRRFVEKLIPDAVGQEMETTAKQRLALAAELRQQAGARLKRTAQLMADAAEHEGGIVFDSQRTVSGELMREAERLEAEADTYRRWLAEHQDKFEKIRAASGLAE